jgi:hypothetical protein
VTEKVRASALSDHLNPVEVAVSRCSSHLFDMRAHCCVRCAVDDFNVRDYRGEVAAQARWLLLPRAEYLSRWTGITLLTHV